MNRAPINERLRSFIPYLTALMIFAASRFVVFLGIIFAARYVPQNPGDQYWSAADSWVPQLLRFDAGWYLSVLKAGYSYNGDDTAQQNVPFYPLYPLFGRALKTLLGISEANALLLVSNLSIIIAILLFFKLIREQFDEERAFAAVGFLSFFPSSLFFTAAYTESLAFVFIICFFLLLKRERYFAAACCGGLCIAARSVGIVLVLPLLWELWVRYRHEPREFLWRAVAYGTVAVSGLLLYMFYLWRAFGHPLAFASNLRAWEKGRNMWTTLSEALQLLPFRDHLFRIFHDGVGPLTLDPWFFLLFIILLVFFWRRMPRSYALFALGVLLLPYLTHSGGTLELASFTRYILPAFPVFVIMADVSRKRIWLAMSLIGIFASVLFYFTALFAQWYWVA
jgi:hypothetical protein